MEAKWMAMGRVVRMNSTAAHREGMQVQRTFRWNGRKRVVPMNSMAAAGAEWQFMFEIGGQAVWTASAVPPTRNVHQVVLLQVVAHLPKQREDEQPAAGLFGHQRAEVGRRGKRSLAGYPLYPTLRRLQ